MNEEGARAPARPASIRPVPTTEVEDRVPTPEPTAKFAIVRGDKSAEKAPRRSAAEVAATSKRPRRRRPVPSDVASELHEVVAPRELARIELRLSDAARAYERARYTDALKTLRELVRAAPDAASVRELTGLTYYRLGRWRDALRELHAFVDLTGSVDQHPVLADAERALGRHSRVEELWAELRRAGAGSDVLAEGRLVMAGSYADRGRIADAIALLEPSVERNVRKPLPRHLRQWYSLADLYERSGDLPRARELFRRVVTADAEATNAPERLAALR